MAVSPKKKNGSSSPAKQAANNNKNKKTTATPPPPPTELVLRDTDVICGRGSGTATFIGNVEFRYICWKMKGIYSKAHRSDKAVIAQKIMDQIAALKPSGRFVELIEGTQLEERRCYKVPFEQALEKTCQALREKKNGCPRQYKQAETSGDKNKKSINPSEQPKISNKDLSLIKKKIEKIVTDKVSPSKTKAAPAATPVKKPEQPEVSRPLRTTSRLVQIDEKKKQEEEKKLAEAASQKNQTATKRPAAATTTINENDKDKDTTTKPAASKKAKTTSSVVGPKKAAVATKTIPKAKPASSTNPRDDSRHVPSRPSHQATFHMNSIGSDSSDIEDDDDLVAEENWKARIFSAEAATNKTANNNTTTTTTAHTAASTNKTLQLKASPSETTKEPEKPKYPYVPYPYCFLQSLLTLETVPDPLNLTADDILASFSQPKQEEEE
jgi:chemotaxis protein histidine kinase CheA